jgi:hypothetical protein
VEYHFNLRYKGGSLQVYYDNNKIFIISGFFFTRENNYIILKNYIDKIFYTFLVSNRFSDYVKENQQSITHILTKKE